MARSAGFFSEEEMKERDPQLYHRLVGQYIDTTVKLSDPMQGSLSTYLMQQLEKECEARTRNQEARAVAALRTCVGELTDLAEIAAPLLEKGKTEASPPEEGAKGASGTPSAPDIEQAASGGGTATEAPTIKTEVVDKEENANEVPGVSEVVEKEEDPSEKKAGKEEEEKEEAPRPKAFTEKG
ncbi:unnamed protein product [Durusdinium trenchii]|uniref:CCD97-like C-terminal domain-containing protein n=1 Tax=Durusdinium trenchii TaxID=1381693 RepID=A0ABP0L4I3_9DINO